MFDSTIRRRAILLLLALLMMTFSVSAQQPMVRGVFFYSPTCGHCHEVITNHWPGIAEQFGNQLQIMFVDVSTQGGSAIMCAPRARSALTPTVYPCSSSVMKS